MSAKILIGCPTSEHKRYCLDRYLDAVKRFSFKNFDLVLADNSEGQTYYNDLKSKGINVLKSDYSEYARERIVKARNLLRERFLSGGYEWFFSLEQDVIAPPNVIESLLRHNKEIICGVYFKEYDVKGRRTGRDYGKAVLPLLYKKDENDESFLRQMKDGELDGGLIEVAACGLGCIMIKREVLGRIKFRYDPGEAAFDDMWFCKDAEDIGFKIYADTGLRCLHLVRGMDWGKIKK